MPFHRAASGVMGFVHFSYASILCTVPGPPSIDMNIPINLNSHPCGNPPPPLIHLHNMEASIMECNRLYKVQVILRMKLRMEISHTCLIPAAIRTTPNTTRLTHSWPLWDHLAIVTLEPKYSRDETHARSHPKYPHSNMLHPGFHPGTVFLKKWKL